MAIEVIKTELSDVVLFNTITKVTFVIPLNELNKVKDKLDDIHVPNDVPEPKRNFREERKYLSSDERRARLRDKYGPGN